MKKYFFEEKFGTIFSVHKSKPTQSLLFDKSNKNCLKVHGLTGKKKKMQ